MDMPPKKPKPERISQLSPREQEVALELVNGRTNHEIAKRLRISVKTVVTHRHHVLSKLGLRNNVDLVKQAIAERLITIELLPPINDESDGIAARAQ